MKPYKTIPIQLDVCYGWGIADFQARAQPSSHHPWMQIQVIDQRHCFSWYCQCRDIIGLDVFFEVFLHMDIYIYYISIYQFIEIDRNTKYT